MTELEAQGYIDDMIRMFKLMKRTSADAELMNKYIAALDVAYVKLNPQDQRPLKGQIGIEDYFYRGH